MNEDCIIWINPLKDSVNNSDFRTIDIDREIVSELQNIFGEVLPAINENKKYLKIPNDIFSDISAFFREYAVLNEEKKKHFFYLLIISINNRLIACKDFENRHIRLFEEFRKGSDQKKLVDVINLYEDNVSKTNTPEYNPIYSITFAFSKGFTRTIKEPHVLSSVMYLISKFNSIEEYDFRELNILMIKITLALFDFFRTTNNFYSAEKKTDLYRMIADIFSLAGIDSSLDAIKKRIQRKS